MAVTSSKKEHAGSSKVMLSNYKSETQPYSQVSVDGSGKDFGNAQSFH